MIEIKTSSTSKDNIVSFEQLRQDLFKSILKNTTISPNLDKLGFIGMINRTNTGALTTAIGRAPTERPVTRHIQPIKAIARRLVQEQVGIAPSTKLTYLKDSLHIRKGIQLVKETIGPNPNNPAEWMEGLPLLLEAGVPVEKIFFIPTVRDPLDTMLSWMRMWNWDIDNFPFTAFNASFDKTLQTIQASESLGMLVVPYVHEFLRDFGAKQTLERIMAQCGLLFNISIIKWDSEEDAYWQGQIVKYDLPPDEFIEGSLSKKHGGRGGLIWQEIKPRFILSEEQKDFVLKRIRTAIEVYNFIINFSRQQLGF